MQTGDNINARKKRNNCRVFTENKYFFIFLFGGIIFYTAVKLLSSRSTFEITSTAIIFIIIIMTSILCYSFQKSTIIITESSITYSGGFLKKTISFSEILSANIIQKKDIPDIRYKIWAYYAFEEKNGLFKLMNGEKSIYCWKLKHFFILGNKRYGHDIFY